MKKNPTMTYAQSSDIKNRTFEEYRKDMKKKAIVELEILPWLQSLLGHDKKVAKHGTDRDLWFKRKGGITREPDYIVSSYGNPEDVQFYIEFQYSKEKRKEYHFKKSKVKRRGKKYQSNTKILYIIQPLYSYGLIDPEFVTKKGAEKNIAAWGSRLGYEIKSEDLELKLQKNKDLREICTKWDRKIRLLEFQFLLLSKYEKQLHNQLEDALSGKIFSLRYDGKLLDYASLFQILFVLQNTKGKSKNALNLLDQLSRSLKNRSFSKMDAIELFRLAYCLDFLYFSIEEELAMNGIQNIVTILEYIHKAIIAFQKSLSYDDTQEFRDQLQHLLYVINSYEDVKQDFLHYYNSTVSTVLQRTTVIFESLENLEQIFELDSFDSLP